MTTTTIQTVAALRASQVIWPEWMAAAVAGLAESDLVSVRRRALLGACYVLSIEPAVEAAR